MMMPLLETLQTRFQSVQFNSLQKIPGDASSRQYFRLKDEKKRKSWILMQMERFAEQEKKVPFLVVQNHLAGAGVDVPRVIDFDSEKGWILLEDLGDLTLLRCLQGVASDDQERHLYERAIDILVQLQVHASPNKKPAEIESYRLRFDVEKLLWEVEFTIEQFYELYLKRTISGQDRKVLNDQFQEICRRLADEPVVLTHRDYHSRNIMVVPHRKGDRFVMIDFQDARLGPAQYDLASLLKDSYYQLEEKQIQRLIDYYILKTEANSGARIDRPAFEEIFDLMSIQRNFKAIGSFASFLNKKGDATYLKYIGNTFENIRRCLSKYPHYSKLREVLFHYYYF